MKKSLLLCLSFVVLISTAGCPGEPRPAGFPTLYPVVLKVTQEGKPLDDATVQLKAIDADSTWSTGGVTDASGSAVLWTHGKFKGAPAGKFKVSVSKEFVEGEKEYNELLDKMDNEAAAKVKIHRYTFVEEQYSRFDKTPIEIEITKSSKTLDIDAGKAIKVELEYMR